MLQQTQIATVIPYYRRFLKAFPSVESLARAPLEQVLELWSGLGYYRRARHLHQAAKLLVKRFRGQFPCDYHEARSLPGVGDYTARAVLSIAFGLPYAVLDGNVARVVARLAAIPGSFNQPDFRRAVDAELCALLSPQRPGDFNQAMMELGQTICLPRSPRCPACPLRAWCVACRRGNPEAFPRPRRRPATRARHLAVAVIHRDGRYGLVRGLDEGLLADLWNFPAAFGGTRHEALGNLRARLSLLARRPAQISGTVARLNHQITYRAIRVEAYAATLRRPVEGVRWVKSAALDGAAISQLTRKIAKALEEM